MMSKKDFLKNRFTRRKALASIGGIVGGTFLLNNNSVTKNVKTPSSQRQPNIIWLISDDVSRPDHGCYGNPVRTPNIDRLAEEGVRFTSAYATSPSCSPSRVSMFTGKYPHSAGAEDLHWPLPPEETILPSMLRNKGYFSANCAKLHLGTNGAKQFDKIYKNSTEWRQFAKERPRDKPFFLSIGFGEAHRPYKKGLIENPHSPDKVIIPPYLAVYYDEISHMDSEIGRLLNWLDEEGLVENTLVFYFGDQGMPFPRAKTTLYDSGIGVPLIAKWKGNIPEGMVQTGLASLVDLVPTMLDIVNIEPNKNIQGKSILNMLLDADSKVRECIFSERNWHDIDDHIRCVRSNRCKYIRNYYPEEPFGHPADIVNSKSYKGMLRLLDEGKLSKQQMLIFRSVRPQEELYDLIVDPNEFENLIYKIEYRNILEKLRLTLDKWINDTNDVSPEKRMINGINIRTGKWIARKGPNPRK